MSVTLDQLQQRPEALLTTALDAVLRPDSGVHGSDLVGQFNADGTVTLTPTQEASDQPQWRYYGHAVGGYAPLDMGVVFGSYELRLKVDATTTATAVAALLASIFQVNLTAADVIEEAITVTPGMAYLLKAHPTSRMWTGYRTVKLYLHTLNDNYEAPDGD